jgi:hypothetical protein
MNSTRVLAAEYIVAVGFASYSAVKDNQLPWPPTVVRTGIAFGILGVAASFSPELATVLGGGFLLAQLMRALEKKPAYTGGAPKNLGDGLGELTGKADSGQIHTGILSFNNAK